MKRFKYQDFYNELLEGNLHGVFIDDTGSPGLSTTPNHLHVDRKSWVGVIVPPKYMNEVLKQFPEALSELKQTVGAAEFHFTDIYSGRGVFKNIDLSLRLALFEFMTHIFTVYKFPIFVQTLDPVTLNNWRIEGNFPSNLGPFNFKKQEDTALFILLTRIKKYLISENGIAQVFVDEGYKKNGIAIQVPYWESVFNHGLICFAKSSSILPIQLADFAAFCLNKSQMILGKEEPSDLDRHFLEIISPLRLNFQNIETRMIDFDNWKDRFNGI